MHSTEVTITLSHKFNVCDLIEDVYGYTYQITAVGVDPSVRRGIPSYWMNRLIGEARKGSCVHTVDYVDRTFTLKTREPMFKVGDVITWGAREVYWTVDRVDGTRYYLTDSTNVVSGSKDQSDFTISIEHVDGMSPALYVPPSAVSLADVDNRDLIRIGRDAVASLKTDRLRFRDANDRWIVPQWESLKCLGIGVKEVPSP